MGRSVSFEATNDVGPLRLYSDETGDAVYDHFWEITSTGVFRGGENEELQTSVRVSSSLTIGPDLLFAAGDINADQHHDILTFNTVTGVIDAWIMDNDSGDLVKALDAENPYAFTTFPEDFPEPANIQQFGFASAPSEVSVGAIPDLFLQPPTLFGSYRANGSKPTAYPRIDREVPSTMSAIMALCHHVVSDSSRYSKAE